MSLLSKKTTKKAPKKQSLDLKEIGPLLKSYGPKLLSKLGFILLLVAFGLVISAALIVNFTVFNTADDEDYRLEQEKEKSVSTSFDQKTIDEVELLNKRDDAEGVRLPGGDINPFQ